MHSAFTEMVIMQKNDSLTFNIKTIVETKWPFVYVKIYETLLLGLPRT